MIAVTETGAGCVLAVLAQARARRNGVVGEHAGALKVAVTAPPEDGKANRALVELLQNVLGVKRSQVELLAGETTRQKRFLIRNLAKQELQSRLARWLTG